MNFRCLSCHALVTDPIEVTTTEPFALGEATVHHPFTRYACPSCDGDVDRVQLCEACGEWECHDGLDTCFQCACDSVQRDPIELESYSRALQVEIGKELARRLGRVEVPVIRMTVRQAS